MKIDKVKITGFKSFADPVEFSVLPGITGVVGPNGCGKSNLLEAFRWAMGETSAKRMRADGMDDVIFGGTETRPARASCEVAVVIDNSNRRAPAEFNGSDTITAVRRLDRGDGSSYRVNGTPARARDVQMLFQDASIGAGSAALVSQGKVAAIIQSKPSDRRSILEEAAGISGLATRRRDAEIRLKATEQNLEKAATLERGLGEQLVSLRKQARQAARRRSLDDLIRASEAAAFLVRWNQAVAKKVGVEASHVANEKKVVDAIVALKAAEAALSVVEIEVAPSMQLRAESETAVAVARATFEMAEKDIVNSKNAAASAARAVERAQADVEHDRIALEEIRESLEDLMDRKLIAEDGFEQDDEKINDAKKIVDGLELKISEIAAQVETVAVSVASAEASARTLEGTRKSLVTRQEGLEARLSAVRARIKEDEARILELNAFSDDLEAADAAVMELSRTIAALSEEATRAASMEMEGRRAVSEMESLLKGIRAEADGLKSISKGAGSLASALTVDEGMESALAAALGETLAAGLTENGAKWWDVATLRVSPPHGTVPLSSVVRVPEQIAAAISGIGVVEGTPAPAMVSRLEAGQSIVSTDGVLWRWDGYRSSESGVAAEALRRAARLQSLLAEDAKISAQLPELNDVLKRRSEDLIAIKRKETEANTEIRKAAARLDEARRARQKAADDKNSVSARLLASETITTSILAEIDVVSGQLATCLQEISSLPETAALVADLNVLRATLATGNGELAVARERYEKTRRDAELRKTTIIAVNGAIEDAQRKQAASSLRHKEMTSRLDEARLDLGKKQAAAQAAPQLAAEAKERFQAATENLAAVIARVADGERRLADHRIAAKQSSDVLAGLREVNAGLLVEMKALHTAEEELRREIFDRLSCAPDALQAASGLSEGEEMPDVAACDARVARLVRERDALGVVNLLAEQQVEEIEGKVGEAKKAMDELRETVSRLRKSIVEFDREARSRLLEAFAAIDGHFKTLFTRLFGGGHAHLRLSGSDDPLEAGLEVYACPPGKKLQTMSLLSGGEQALAALALVFAVFMVNPAPVCVLDEVDAPLDDANVDRLCGLVQDMAANDATRFLVVTHHTLTMSKVDRLYGVTMGERGVSKLATLDMAEAAAFVGA